jgi:hypothetical protein
LLALILAPGALRAGDDLQDRLSAVAVFIKVEGLGLDNRPSHWTGSGVAIHRGGWVVTNRHVAPGNARTANTIRVIFNTGASDEFSGPADVVLVHADRDLALLKCRLDRDPITVPLGETKNLKLTQPVVTVGFPLGQQVAVNNANPSVSIVTGKISSLQKCADGRLCWIDAATAVAGGNSGSPMVDERGDLVGIVSRRYEGFARAIPVEFVRELLGEAALDITSDPTVADGPGRNVRIVVKPRGPASKLVSGRATRIGARSLETRLVPAEDGTLEGTLSISAKGDGGGDQQVPVRIRAITDTGFAFQRIVDLRPSGHRRVPLRGTVHSITLSRRKPNGWRWDGDDPDPFLKLYVNGFLVKQTSVVRNQRRFLEATEFDCNAGDEIRIVVYDRDIRDHDWAGEISFTAEPNQPIREPTAGKLDACEITLRPIPLRPPVTE